YLNGDDVVYAYTPDFTGAINMTMTPQGQKTGMFVYTNCADIGVNCAAGVANGGSGIRAIQNFAVTSGVTYYIVLSSLPAPQNFLYNLAIERVFCLAPTALAANPITSSTADLSWTENAGATSWEVAVRTVGTTGPIVATATTTAPSYQAQSLLQTTAYEYYVRSSCGAGTFSPWTGPFNFVTQCGLFQSPFFEGFNSTSLSEACWTVTNVDGGQAWNMNYAFNPFEGNQSASISTTVATNNDWLISPRVHLTGTQRLKFRYRVGAATAPSGFKVLISTTGTAPADFTTELLPVASYTNIEYLEKIIYLNTYTQDVHIAFQVPPGAGGAANSRLFIDAVSIEEIPSCPEPLNLTAGNIGLNTADLSWTQGFQETAWDIVVQAPTVAAPTPATVGLPVPGTTPNYPAAGLTPGTDYVYYVRASCGPGGKSAWVGPYQFRTLLCLETSKCNYTFRMTDSGGNGWQGNTMNIVQNGVTVATIGSTFTTGSGPIDINVAMCPGVEFKLIWNTGGTNFAQVGIAIYDTSQEDVYIKAPGIGVPGTTLFTGIMNCTPPLCKKPKNLTATGITQSGALLGWTE
ncbi:choice-of-anchor J domain-containing protein, partial [Flavobacterium sp. '19STA2R22 D10 B1']|uniref:choice-of-anchor J domain-containing protein n=1 Tax=Flavobacterium aerium TaxID=3037261 RepID=UPI00278BBCBE